MWVRTGGANNGLSPRGRPPMNDAPSPLSSLADHLSTRREELLEAWRQAGLSDPAQPTAQALTHTQFFDHIPELLDALEQRLRHRPGSGAVPRPDHVRQQELKHGLQRWQQGYRLEELMREWGHLHRVINREVEIFARSHVAWSLEAQWSAHREIVDLIHEGVAESTAQYARLERHDAAGRLNDLQEAVGRLHRLNEHRTVLLRQAVHDLRGNVQSVSNVADLLGSSGLAEEERIEFATLLQHNIDAVAAMLAEMLELTRLEAGQESRVLAPFDAAQVVRDFCEVNRPRARARKLYLRLDGPPELPVIGDSHKVRRLLQNLLINALKYTEQGGVAVSWGTEGQHWWVRIQDTGPGLMGGPGAPLVLDLRDATSSAREAEERLSAAEGREPTVLDQAEVGAPRSSPSPRQLPGEGIGLSIVKRLCDLLEASLELVSSSNSGTIIRVVFPRDYPATGETSGKPR